MTNADEERDRNLADTSLGERERKRTVLRVRVRRRRRRRLYMKDHM